MRVLIGLVSLVVLNLPAQDIRLQKQIALGEKLASQFRQNTTPIDSASVQEYVDRIGQRLDAQIPDSRSQYRFEVIADDRGGYAHQPVAFPGGYVFVPAPLILAAQNEAEFACMLADAMAVLKAQNRQSGSEIWFSYESGVFPVAIARQADTDAVKIASSAGFDPAALGRYIARVHQSEARLAVLEEAIQRLPARTYTGTGDFARVQEEVRRASAQRARRPPSLLRK